MTSYVSKRLLRALVTVIGISIIVFVAARMSGDPVLALAPENATAAELAKVRADMGLDRPVWVQYARFAEGVAHGEFGRSFRYQRPALGIVLDRLVPTLQLGLSAFLLATVLGVSLGVAAALHKGKLIDGGLRSLAVLGQSAPSFWIGMMAILLLAVDLHWLPSNGRQSFQSMIMPTVALALFSIASIMRMTRSAMLETLGGDYIKFLRIKGVPEAVIIWKHALRNALIPIVAILGLQLGHLIGGAIIIEVVFNWPGLGRLMAEALTARDFPVIQSGVTVISIFMVLLNLTVDLLFCVIDPRIRYE